jgi:hypothetical protein
MRISNRRLRYGLDVLRGGGAEGVRHFLKMGQKCFYEGGQELLNRWIELAAPALPVADRYRSIGALMGSLFGDEDETEKADDERHTLQ